MSRISSIGRPERRRLQKIIQRSKDKRFSRRANAILLIHDGVSCTQASKLLSAARSSINRWCQWYEQCGLDGLKDAPQGRPPVLPGYYSFWLSVRRKSWDISAAAGVQNSLPLSLSNMPG